MWQQSLEACCGVRLRTEHDKLAVLRFMTIQMQILQFNHWIDVHTRCQTKAGMKRIYKAFVKENTLVDPVCGMRIITVHFEHLGAFPRKTPDPRPHTRKWLKKFAEVQRRTAKSTLQLGTNTLTAQT